MTRQHLEALARQVLKDRIPFVCGVEDNYAFRVHILEPLASCSLRQVLGAIKDEIAAHVFLHVTCIDRCAKHDDCLHSPDLGRACLATYQPRCICRDIWRSGLLGEKH